MKTFTVQSDQQTLAVTRHGDERNPVIVLVHGYPDDQTVWKKVSEELEQDFHVVTFDVRGAGESTAPANWSDYRMENFSRDLMAIINAVSPERPVHLVGHDWGSIHTWESVTDPALQNRIASFTSISGPCLDHMGFWLREKLAKPSFKNLKALALQLIKSWYVFLFHLPGSKLLWRLGLARLWPTGLKWTEGIDSIPSPTQKKNGLWGVNNYRANFMARLLFPRERYTRVPVQLIIPSRDNYVSTGLFENLTQWVSHLYVRQIDAGHWLPLKSPQPLANDIKTFVSFCENGAGSQQINRLRVTDKVSRFSGKLAVVTGAASGIGRATALALAEKGASVVAVDLNLAGAERTAELARLFGVSAWAKKLDVGDGQAMERLRDVLDHECGAVDIVVNNAGIGMAGGMLQTSQQDWQRILNVNLWGVINGSRIFAQQMAAQGISGHIVNVASAAAFMPSKSYPAYATSKAAVFMMTECLRAELADRRIGVSVICPGFVDTGIAKATEYVGLNNDEQERVRAKAHKLYQWRGFKPEKVAEQIVQAIETNKAVTLVGMEASGARLLQRTAPMLNRWLARFDMSPG